MFLLSLSTQPRAINITYGLSLRRMVVAMFPLVTQA
jgi:hypothetical protein